MLKIPEYILHSQVSQVISFIRKDLKTNSNTLNKSVFFQITDGMIFEGLNFWEQSKGIFENDEESGRFLKADLIYNATKDTPPNIYINCPSEVVMGGGNGMGVDEGYSEKVLTRRYSATYDIVINSDNSNEVIILYHILRSLLVSLTNHLSTLGLENISISGQDLMPNQEVQSQQRGFYMKVIRMHLEYESSALNFDLKTEGFSGIFFTGKIKL